MLTFCRKLPDSKLKRSSSSKKPRLPPKPEPFSTAGSDTKDKSSSDNRKSWPRVSLPKYKKSLRTPSSCNRFCSKV